MSSGLAEHEWASENPTGTKAEFNAHFKGLSKTQLQVRTMVDVDNITDSMPQDLKEQSKNEVVLKHPQFQGHSDALSSLLQ